MAAQDVQEVKARVQRLTDVVIGVVIIGMAIRLPLRTDPTHLLNWEGVRTVGPHLIAFAISFFTVAVVWSNNLGLTASLRHPTRGFIWLTLLVLFWIALFPVVTAFLGRHFGDPVAICVYGGVMIGMSVSLTAMRFFLAAQDRGNPQMARIHAQVTYRAVAAVLIYLGAIPLAYVSFGASLLCCALTPAMFVIGNPAAGGVSPLPPARTP